ncbi:MAG: caspase family protein [Candidatus Riflebacteria bacterium]|nr:caspase family protein [Candidatus Riflebacteria bacterium]
MDVQLRLLSKKPYLVGGHARYAVRTVAPMYVWSYCFTSDGRCERVFPPAGQTYLFRPESGKTLTVEGDLTGPPGRECVVALTSSSANTDPAALVQKVLRREQGPQARAARLEQLWSAGCSGAQWGFASLDYELGANDGASPAGKRVALLIGISRYKHLPIQCQLGYAATDAARMHGLLERTRQRRRYVKKLLRDDEATRANVLEGINRWLPSQVAHGDQVVIYFSGHGTQVPEAWQPAENGRDEADGLDEALVPSDARPDEVPDRRSGAEPSLDAWKKLVLDDQLHVALQRLSDAGAGQIWLILDCCHSGSGSKGGLDGLRQSESRSRYLPISFLLAPSPSKGDAPWVQAFAGARERPVQPDWHDVSDIPKLVFLGACQAGESAFEWPVVEEDDPVGGGVFTYYLARALQDSTPGAADRLRPVPVIERVRGRVKSWVDRNRELLRRKVGDHASQVPVLELGKEAEEFSLGR